MRISDWSSDVCSSDLQKQTGQSASPFTVADYYLNTIGGVKDKKVADDEKGSGADEPIVDVGYDADLRRKNPLVSLFGAGEPWLTGRLAVSHLHPRTGEVAPTTQFTGKRERASCRASARKYGAHWLDAAPEKK